MGKTMSLPRSVRWIEMIPEWVPRIQDPCLGNEASGGTLLFR